MADGVFNIAKGGVKGYYERVKNNDPTNAAFIMVMLKASEVDDTLNNYDDLGTLIAAAGNTEADFTNYARKTLVDTDLAAVPAPDDTNNRIDLDLPDWLISAAGGATNNTLTKLLICYDSDTTAGTDSNIIPVCYYDFAVTTDGSDLTAQINASGFYRAA